MADQEPTRFPLSAAGHLPTRTPTPVRPPSYMMASLSLGLRARSPRLRPSVFRVVPFIWIIRTDTTTPAWPRLRQLRSIRHHLFLKDIRRPPPSKHSEIWPLLTETTHSMPGRMVRPQL